jgi:NAD(P)-dependent dehydrogenase (short-subunit alcohol dehydrogenase family)
MLAGRGYDVVLNGIDEGIESVSKEVRGAGANVLALPGDVTEPETIRSIVERTAEHFGRLDALVNNAGSGLTRPFSSISLEDWDRHFDLHVKATAIACQCASELLRNTRGAVVNLASIAAHLALPGRVAYSSAKGSIVAFTRALGCEWAPQNVRVNAVAPGTIATPLVERNFEAGLLDKKGVLERTPMKRLGKPEEVAGVIVFLLSDEASYITGQTINVDGGWSAWGGW